MAQRVLRIGTRQSKLALAQARRVAVALEALGCEVTLVPMKSEGDTVTGSLLEAGGKGLFVKEIEKALLEDRVDCAVHSLKDMETALPASLMIGAVLERDDPRDVWISREGKALREITPGARVGTSSVRRALQLRLLFPTLEVVPIRGNLIRRLEKLEDGQVDGLILACAGFQRLGLMHCITHTLSIEDFLPAVGQGMIAAECRVDDLMVRAALQRINHIETWICAQVERGFLRGLDGSCSTPIGGYAVIEMQDAHPSFIRLKGMVGPLGGQEALSQTWERFLHAPPSPHAWGCAWGVAMKKRAREAGFFE